MGKVNFHFYVNGYIDKIKLVTIVDSDPKAPFLLGPTPRCW